MAIDWSGVFENIGTNVLGIINNVVGSLTGNISIIAGFIIGTAMIGGLMYFGKDIVRKGKALVEELISY
jgi:hypothetical protein